MGTNNAVLTGGGAVVILNPEHAQILRAAEPGWRFSSVFWRATHYPKEQLVYYAKGFAERIKGDEYRCFEKPEDILVLMAGGSGLYPWLCPPQEPTAITVM